MKMAGKRYNNLTCVKIADRPDGSRYTYFLFRCDCGNEITVPGQLVKGGRIKSCRGCALGKTAIKGNKNPLWRGVGELSSTQWAKTLKRSGKPVEVGISMEYAWELFIKQERRCALTGMELSFGGHIRDFQGCTASLDRIDNSRGYVDGNVQWVHKHINMLKHAFDQQYFIRLCKAVADYHK
jgi:hypothetical protein